MAVRFVVSRAGGGKTAHCLEAVRRRLRVSATDGPPLILLVPEQAAMQTERALIETPDIAGYTRCEVLSFRRLAFRILTDTSGTDREEVSPLSRLMVLRYLLGRRKRSLRVYGRLADRGGFVARLADQFVELFVQAVAPDDLRTVAADASSADRTLADKLHDLSLLYADYLTYLGDGRVDTDQYLDLAWRRLPQATWLRGAEVWADGFAVFSRQEERLLAALAGVAARVEVTFLVDPDAAVLPPSQGRPEPGHLFHQIEDTLDRFARSLTQSGVAIEPPIRYQPAPLPRFAGAPDLATLERRLFAAPPVPPMSRRLATSPDSTRSRSASVRIVETATRRVEVDRCVAQIQAWVQRDRDPLRYRDIAVIVRQIEVYHELLSAAFDAHEIPYFLDRRRPVAHHPLVELIRALTALCANDLDVASIRLLLKTGLTGLDGNDADRLENGILAHGIRSRRVWLSPDPWVLRPRRTSRTAIDESAPTRSPDAERINELRRRLMAPLRGLLETSAGGARASGQEWAGALFAVLDALAVPDQLERWARSAEADGRIDEAEEHRQVWRDGIDLLDELVRALGAEPMSVRQFGDVLDTGLSQFTLGLAPPSLDQVLIGSVERSRHPDIRAAIVLGFNEGQFPTLATDAGVLTDRENEVLRRADLRIGRGREMRLDQERLLTYIALTRPRERLQLSYAAADEDGRALAPSPYLPFVLGAVPNAVIEFVGDPTESRETWSIGTAGELSARLALELAQRPDRERDDAERRARWNALYDQARHSTGCPAALTRALSSLAPPAPPRLTTTAVDALYGHDRPWSATQLETVAWCPFKHFAQHGLRLTERAVLGLEPVDVGRLHHAVLEQVINDLMADEKRLADLDHAALSDRLATAAEMHATRLEQEAILTAPRTAYVLRRTAHDLQRAAAAQRTVSAAGRFRPAATEVPFGFPDRPGSLPALDIETPGGRHIRLRGFVDRVDVADGPDGALGMIVDYKRTGSKPLNLSRVMAGLELQLMTYLLVLADHGDALLDQATMPAGTFYFNIKPEYKTVAHPDQASRHADAVEGPYRPRGLFDGAHLSAFDASLTTGASQIVSAHRNKDGSLGKRRTTDVADSPQIRGLLSAARRQLGALGDQVLDGEIDVRPANVGNGLPCNWCPYNGVCRFEPITGRTRTIPKTSREQILRTLDHDGPAA